MKLRLLVIVITLTIPLIMTSSTKISPIHQASGLIDGGNLEAVNITSVEFAASGFNWLPAINIGDGVVSKIWADIPAVSVASYGSNGQIQAAYGRDTIYFLLTFSSDLLWVAMQWDASTSDKVVPMQQDDDMWVFGTSQQTQSTFYGDGYSAGQGVPPFIFSDKQNDLSFEMIPGDKVSYIEVSRNLLTGDTAGRDIQLQLDSQYTIMYASDQFHGSDNLITRQIFELSKNAYGDATTKTSVVQATIDQYVFLIKYSNLVLTGSLALLLLIMLPIQLIWRHK